MTRLAVVIPTRNRPEELRRLLDNLASQSRVPDQTTVIDGSDTPSECESIVASHRHDLNIQISRHWPPSAAAQRNAGIALVGSDMDLVALLDDDILLDADCFEHAIRQIENMGSEWIGFGLNPRGDHSTLALNRFRRARLAQMMGLYFTRPGAVAPSGWHTRSLPVSTLTEVDWLISGAVIWRVQVLRTIHFDEFFVRYSYLEDLEFSLQARHLGRMAVLPDARYEHRPAQGGRGSSFWFGRIEVRNRYYIVLKHGLSQRRFFCGMLIRMGLTITSIIHSPMTSVNRFVGNIIELTRLSWVKKQVYRNFQSRES
jgi:GT2 family glycosyltransferase